LLKSEIADRKKFLKTHEVPDTFIAALDLVPQYISLFKSSKQDDAEAQLPNIVDQITVEDVPHVLQYHLDKEMALLDSSRSGQESLNGSDDPLDSVPQKLM
jgi:hypothetical protein